MQTGAWILPDQRPLPAELESFLDAGTPPVYVGFGSMAAPTDIARVAIDAIRAQGHRALVARGWAHLALIDDRDDCLAVGEVNQQALFGRVAAAVHHGGAGTTTTAARAGAPQVVVPQMADQPYWAGRVADLGIGAAHDGPAQAGMPNTDGLGADAELAGALGLADSSSQQPGRVQPAALQPLAFLLCRRAARDGRHTPILARRAPRLQLNPGLPQPDTQAPLLSFVG